MTAERLLAMLESGALRCPHCGNNDEQNIWTVPTGAPGRQEWDGKRWRCGACNEEFSVEIKP